MREPTRVLGYELARLRWSGIAPKCGCGKRPSTRTLGAGAEGNLDGFSMVEPRASVALATGTCAAGRVIDATEDRATAGWRGCSYVADCLGGTFNPTTFDPEWLEPLEELGETTGVVSPLL
mmetsp:Transcript_15454/g.39867  ORF Transcript_15454/g.39867 Transcript_15454/m.39867 type:complete len:121 (+) Transcript_15454:456-818(+)